MPMTGAPHDCLYFSSLLDHDLGTVSMTDRTHRRPVGSASYSRSASDEEDIMGEVVGPVTEGRHGWAFGASTSDLAAVGYVEEEYFLDGEATHFVLAPGTSYRRDGRWAVTEGVRSRYRTRFLVRRPMAQEDFCGTVIVNWNNVSLGFEFLTGMSSEVIASGSAWVGATVQTIGLTGFPGVGPEGLLEWDPERYGSLTIADDDASFDVFTQVAAAVGPNRPTGAVDPMAGLVVDRVLAAGESQSACRLATYFNAVQPRDQVFDGFLLVVYAGGGTRVEAAGEGPSLEAIPAELRPFINIMPFGSHLLRSDLSTPVLVLNSETEAPWYQAVRQPDTSTYRLWEVAGAAHLSGGFGSDLLDQWRRDFGEVPNLAIATATSGLPNSLSFRPVDHAALRHLNGWVRGGDPAPVQDRIEFAGQPLRIRRDEYGNALGGIRLPDFEVPVATHRGEGPTDVPDLVGSDVPFSAETLGSLYPDDEAYLKRYEVALEVGLARGFLLEKDADELRAGALDNIRAARLRQSAP
jgi:hypothetical protein